MVTLNKVSIGKGKIFEKDVYANKDFKMGEIVIKYNLKTLTNEEYIHKTPIHSPTLKTDVMWP